MWVCICSSACIGICVCHMHACMHASMHAYVCAHARLCVWACMRVCMACLHVCVCVCCLMQYQFDTLFSTSYVLLLLLRTYRISQMFGWGKFWQLSHKKLLASKTLVNLCLFAFLTSWDIVKFWWTTSDLPNLPRFSSAKHSYYTQKMVQNVVCIQMLQYIIHVRG